MDKSKVGEVDILSLPMGKNDAEAPTVGEYLKALLLALWEQNESFSGKRPFGNSGWRFDIYVAMIEGGAVGGTLDEHGDVNEIDTEKADALISDAIMTLCWTI